MHRNPLSSLALLGLLSLASCKHSPPKPTHEIGKVEYDKIVDWRELLKLGPTGCRKYLGQTVTFTNMVSRGSNQTDRTRPNTCAQAFDLMFWPYVTSNGKEGDGQFFLDVYFNFGPEVIRWIIPAQPDTFITDVAIEHPIQVKELICDSCSGNHDIVEIKGQKVAISQQGVENCILESRALHITGKVVGVRANENAIMIIPTGMSW